MGQKGDCTETFRWGNLEFRGMLSDSGLWFGTWLGSFAIYWECHHPNWRTHMFQRGRYTTNQYMYYQNMIVQIVYVLSKHDSSNDQQKMTYKVTISSDTSWIFMISSEAEGHISWISVRTVSLGGSNPFPLFSRTLYGESPYGGCMGMKSTQWGCILGEWDWWSLGWGASFHVFFSIFSINTLWRVSFFFSINIEILIMYELRKYLRHPNRVKRLETPVVLDNFWCLADGKTSRILQGI